jgi:methylenetetrahydrofolate--tRNA-(uracil-5-)-methyltransferase
MSMPDLTVIGGGLSGCEAAWQAAERGIDVTLYEMRPTVTTGAHQTDKLAELVCSNSLGSDLPDRASGLLKNECRTLGSLLFRIADQTAVPAGGALAVDREAFADGIATALAGHPHITIVREEVTDIPARPCVIASGPLTSPALSDALARLSGDDHLYFFDAISPIVAADSINMDIAFRASRYDRGEDGDGDYINCPLDEPAYDRLVDALAGAERISLHSFEAAIEHGVKAGAHTFFEGCLPVEIIAARGRQSLAFGPLRPVGLRDPRTDRRPFAVVQLRQDNLAGSLYNLVGFQTNLKFSEQKRVFSLIPGLESAEFVRFGQMHRNTFIASPRLLEPTLAWRTRPDLFVAGQLCGIEGYAGNIASGLLAGINAAHHLAGRPLIELPRETMLGALTHYIARADMADFQPMKANFGIMPDLPPPPAPEPGMRRRKLGKRERAEAHRARAEAALEPVRAQANADAATP